MPAEFSDLPPELLPLILGPLVARRDLYSVCLVCRSWREVGQRLLLAHVRLFGRDLVRSSASVGRTEGPHSSLRSPTDDSPHPQVVVPLSYSRRAAFVRRPSHLSSFEHWPTLPASPNSSASSKSASILSRSSFKNASRQKGSPSG